MKNKFLKKVICVGLISFSLLNFNVVNVKAETTQTTSHYNQWIQENGEWKYYDTFGQLEKDCWIRDIDGKYYYLDDNGIMLTNKWIDNYYVGVDGAWVRNTTILKTNRNTYVKIQEDVTDTEEDEDNYDYSSYHKKKVKDNTDTSSSVNESTSDESNSDTTSSTSDDYYDYSSKGSNETWVSGYYRNGKYVSGHYRTKKDSTTSNNYSHKGNTNPHNGKKGYKK